MEEWIHVVTSMWDKDDVNFEGKYYQAANTILQPKPTVRPRIYAGGESEAGKNLIAKVCDGYVMHGDTPEVIAQRINDVKERREKQGLPPMTFGVAGYAVVRSTEQEVKKEIARITDVQSSASGYDNYQQWLNGTQLEKRVSLEDYSVSNRGLRTGLAGTPEQIAERIYAFEQAGVDFFLLQTSPQLEEMERFSEAMLQYQS